MNEEYLGFVDEIGRTTDGKYLYRFDFTYDPDSLWGAFPSSRWTGGAPTTRTCRV